MRDPKKQPPLSVPDLTAERIQALRELLPEAFSEGRIDFEKLRAALGDIVEDSPERYSFSWAGKRDALRLLQTPTRATLVPCPEESLNVNGDHVIARAKPEAISSPTGDRHAGEAPARDDNQSHNIFIEGDNLEALKLLYKPYFGRIKMIYIDPPYNTGNDFIYPDDYSDPLGRYLELTGQQDEAGNLLTSNPETSGRYHSAWLSMMYPRLFLARQLLREDGVIFVSIDDHEVYNLRLLMNEIFGEENHLGTIVWKGATDNNPTQIAVEHEYIVCFAKNTSEVSSEWKNKTNDAKSAMLREYNRLKVVYGENIEAIQQDFRKFIRANRETLNPITHYDRLDEVGPYTGSRKVHNPKPGGYEYDVIHPVTNKICVPPANGYRYPKERMDELIREGKILFGEDDEQIIQIKEYLTDYQGKLGSVIILDSRAGSNELRDLFAEYDKIFTHPKPSVLLRDLFDFCLEKHDVALDFFAGSCSTAQAILELNREDGGNRRFIMVQLPEPTGNPQFPTIAEIGKERIRRVVARMKDLTPGPSPTRRGEQARQLGMPLETRATPEDLGFRVYKLAASHFKPWAGVDEKEAAAYAQQMELFRDPLVEGWTVTGVLTELALKHGFSLSMRFEALPGAGALYRVSDLEREQSFYVSLAERVALDDLTALNLGKDDLFLCRDAALDDETAANLALQCRLETI